MPELNYNKFAVCVSKHKLVLLLAVISNKIAVCAEKSITGFEPAIMVLQTIALPDCAICSTYVNDRTEI